MNGSMRKILTLESEQGQEPSILYYVSLLLITADEHQVWLVVLMKLTTRQLEMMVEELVAANEEALKEAARNDDETRRQVGMSSSYDGSGDEDGDGLDNQVEALEQQLRAERRFLEEQAAEREVGRHRHPD